MSSRDRRRAERHKRKQRSAGRTGPEAATATNGQPPGAEPALSDLAAEAESRTPAPSRREMRDQ